MPRRPLLALLAIALLFPTVASEAAAPYAPLRVTAEALDSTAVLVEWTPGTEPADSYRVYGVNGSTMVLLLDTSDFPAPLVTSVIVPAGYDTYAVSGVQAGDESAPVFALDGLDAMCIYVMTDPPGIVRKPCKAKLAVMVLLL